MRMMTRPPSGGAASRDQVEVYLSSSDLTVSGSAGGSSRAVGIVDQPDEQDQGDHADGAGYQEEQQRVAHQAPGGRDTDDPCDQRRESARPGNLATLLLWQSVGLRDAQVGGGVTPDELCQHSTEAEKQVVRRQRHHHQRDDTAQHPADHPRPTPTQAPASAVARRAEQRSGEELDGRADARDVAEVLLLAGREMAGRGWTGGWRSAS
jgi:hypothetical protein